MRARNIAKMYTRTEEWWANIHGCGPTVVQLYWGPGFERPRLLHFGDSAMDEFDPRSVELISRIRKPRKRS